MINTLYRTTIIRRKHAEIIFWHKIVKNFSTLNILCMNFLYSSYTLFIYLLHLSIYFLFSVFHIHSFSFKKLSKFNGRESIVLGSHFWNRDFDDFTRFEVSWIRKSHFYCLVCLYVCLCVCYQRDSKTNCSRIIKFDILHMH